MSREHAIYRQGALQPLKTTNSEWAGAFSEQNISGTSPGGVLIEGVYKGRHRHVISDGAGQRHRFIVVFIKPARSYRRRYLADGTEVEYAVGQHKIIKTGYLRTSLKTVQTEESGEIDEAAVRAAVKSSLPSCGGSADCLELWGAEDMMSRIELETDEWVRLKTKGTGPLIESLGKLDQRTVHVSNNAGDSNSSQPWLANIKQRDDVDVLPQDKLEGVDESDWD